jgi:hypothetical protein
VGGWGRSEWARRGMDRRVGVVPPVRYIVPRCAERGRIPWYRVVYRGVLMRGVVPWHRVA